MSYIAFVPGLEGDLSLKARTKKPVPGTYAHAAEQAAHEMGLAFFRLDFQTASRPYLLLSEMGYEVAADIAAFNARYGAGLIVASSIGAGVTLQALANLKESYIDLPPVLLFKPAIDPLSLITERLRAHGASAHLDALIAGKIPALPIPVDPSPQSPAPGTFLLTKAHIEDEAALRLITSEQSRTLFSQTFADTKIPEIRLQTAKDDPMCTVQVADTFARVAEGCTNRYSITLLPGHRSDDHTNELRGEIRAMALDHGLRRA